MGNVELQVVWVRSLREWQVRMVSPYDTWLAAFRTQRAAHVAMRKLMRRVHWCLQPDKLAKLLEVVAVNVGLSDY